MIEFFSKYGFLISVISVVFFLVGSLGTYIWLLKIPSDYFRKKERNESWIVKVMRNLLGLILVLLGILMLFMPGQGLITIFVGLYISDTKVTRSLRERFLKNKKIQRGLDSIRRKHNKKEFTF